MTCPVCGGETKVIDTAGDYEAVYRTRRCVQCEHRFSTIEFEHDDHATLLNLRREMKVGKEEKERRELERKANKLVTILKSVADWAGFSFVGDVRLMHKKSRKEF
jgi:transcriptional regulator NrdR family protein